MCTVTFIAKGPNDFILTSNRDEAIDRKTRLPEVYNENGIKMAYPKDEVAGGTWIGVSERKRLVCLLNGGFVAHERKSSYRLSRGVIVKELLAAKDGIKWMEDFDFTDIEPFTIIMIEWRENLKLYELVWDGSKKHLKEMNVKTHIWSSSPLYTQTMKNIRKKWFSEFLNKRKTDSTSLFDFHLNKGIGNKDVDLQIDRGFLKTVSITQVTKNDDIILMKYRDLKTGNEKEIEINIFD